MIGQPLPPGAADKPLINNANVRVYGGQFPSIDTWNVLAFGLLLWQRSRRRSRCLIGGIV